MLDSIEIVLQPYTLSRLTQAMTIAVFIYIALLALKQISKRSFTWKPSEHQQIITEILKVVSESEQFSFLKLEVMEIVWSATGGSFHTDGPAVEKSLLPNCVCMRGTSVVPDVDDHGRGRTWLSRQRRYECLSGVDCMRGTSKVTDVDDHSRTWLSRQRRYECLSGVDWPRTPAVDSRVHHETASSSHRLTTEAAYISGPLEMLSGPNSQQAQRYS